MAHQVALKRIETVRIVPDPDVQFDWAYAKKSLQRFGPVYDPDHAGVIDVVPLNGLLDRETYIAGLIETYGPIFAETPLDGPLYGAFVGRHRNILARLTGEREMRCDVHEGLTVAGKHVIKLAKDQKQRLVRGVEIFWNEVGAGIPRQTAILGMCEAKGYEIGRLRGGKPYSRFEAVRTLEQCFDDGVLPGVLDLNDIWFGEPKTNTAYWLNGLKFFIKEGYAEKMTDSRRSLLKGLFPEKVIKIAIAESPKNWPVYGAAEGISDAIRKYAGIRKIRS